MSKPSRFFVREYTPDPKELGPDDETDTDTTSASASKARARQMRREGKLACAFERRTIRYPDEAPPGLDLHAYLWDRDAALPQKSAGAVIHARSTCGDRTIHAEAHCSNSTFEAEPRDDVSLEPEYGT